MNEEEETKITSAKEDNGERVVIGEMERVVVSPIVITKDLPPPNCPGK